jgi:hypothetical protein
LSYRKARLTRRQSHRYFWILQAAAEERTDDKYDWPEPGRGRRGSSLAWAAWDFTKRWYGRRGVDVEKLQRVVLDWGSGECIYRFAMDVPGANVRRCQAAVMEDAEPGVMRLFAANVPGAYAPSLEALALVAEVMGG